MVNLQIHDSVHVKHQGLHSTMSGTAFYPMIRFISLPPVSYRTLHSYQDAVVSAFLAAKKTSSPLPQPTIYATTVTPAVYTLGRREKLNRLSSEELAFLQAYPAEVIEAERGGQTTFHGLGQVVLYPLIDLKTFGLTARSWVCVLEKAIIKSLKEIGVSTAHTNEHTGVWVTSKDGVERKIASIGLHLRRGISSHGISVNVENQVLKGIGRITACGLVGREQTSIEKEVGEPLAVPAVGALLGREIAKGLGSNIFDATGMIDMEAVPVSKQ